MSGKIGIPSNADISELFTSIETTWNTLDFTRSDKVEKLTYFRPNARGKQVSLAFSNLSSAPVELLLGADRQFADPEIFKVSVEHKQFVPRKSMQVYEAQLKFDMYNVIDMQNDANQVLYGARNLWENELASTINANGLSFDGVSIFNTAHPVNPLDPALGTYTNDIPNNDLDETGLANAMAALEEAPYLDGQLDSSRVRRVAIVVPTYNLYLKALKLVGLPVGSLVPTAGTAANTSVAATSPFTSTDMGFEVIYLPQLGTNATTRKQWYVMNVTDTRRGFVTSIVEPPVLDIEGPGTSSHIFMLKLAWRFSWHAYGAVAPALPRETVRSTTP